MAHFGTSSLLRLWSRLGIPQRLKLDKWLVPNAGRRLPLVVHLSLALGVILVFIPFAEPWRQGTVEHTNDTFDKQPKDFRIPEELPRTGQVKFIRLIRSDRLLRIMGVKIELPEAFVHEYVTAVFDVRREQLTVIHRGRRVKRVRSVSNECTMSCRS